MDQTKVLFVFLRVGLQVVSARLVLLLGLALVFALFCWAMYDPILTRIACATIFALLVFLPCVAVDRSMSKAGLSFQLRSHLMANFWHKPPKLGATPSQWRPGERRSYIPVVSFGRPENTPAEGVVGKTVDMDGTKRVSFVVRGAKTEGTKKPGER